MRFYASKTHNTLNGSPYEPEQHSAYLCINPYYNVKINNERTRFIIDSGAYQDVGNDSRLSFANALKRQLDYERTVTDTGRPAEAIVSYDRLVDEQHTDKGQIKKRVSEEDGQKYVQETIDAAKYLASRRAELEPRRLILSCQGTTVKQYLYCLDEVLKIAGPNDIIGFGGFCIISRSKTYEEQYYKVLIEAIPKIKEKGITRIHIFGVGIFRVLIQTEIYCAINGIHCSYDTSACEINSVYGRVFDPVNFNMASVFTKKQKKNGYNPAELTIFNLITIINYWSLIKNLPLPDEFTPGIIEGAQV